MARVRIRFFARVLLLSALGTAACHAEPVRSAVVGDAVTSPATGNAQAVQTQGEAEASGWAGVSQAGVDPVLVTEGRKVAQGRCASCHAIDRVSASPLVSAPPLREVLTIYEDEEALAVRFIDGMRVGHNEMPLIDLSVKEADQLILYIRSITAAPKDSP